MKPEEMPNDDLILDYALAIRTSNGCGWTEKSNPQFCELLRRLNEADALRKENEELKATIDYVASFMSLEDVGDDVASPGVVVSSGNLEYDATVHGVLGYDKCEHPFAQPIVDVLGRACCARIESAKQKEAQS
jgi:hypothetical protein